MREHILKIALHLISAVDVLRPNSSQKYNDTAKRSSVHRVTLVAPKLAKGLKVEALSCCLMGVQLCTNPNYLEALCDQCGGHIRGDGACEATSACIFTTYDSVDDHHQQSGLAHRTVEDEVHFVYNSTAGTDGLQVISHKHISGGVASIAGTKGLAAVDGLSKSM